MKTKIFIGVILLLTMAFWCRDAQAKILPKGAQIDLIEENLLIGLNSKNSGLQYSSALMLGKLKSMRAVIPLMALLKNSDNLKIKTAAAWALCAIGDPRGTFAVKREVQFSDCCITRARCAWYYETMVHHGTYFFKQQSETLYAEKETNP